MLKIEKTVLIPRSECMPAAIIVAERCYYSYGYVCRITSWQDGIHSENSYHYQGWAIDFGLAGVDDRHREKIANNIRKNLPDYFDVVFEYDHVHVELDLKKYRLAEG